MLYYQLNNQQSIPKIGCGTSRYGKVNRDFYAELNHDPKEIIQALTVGYRMFDTATIYRNEELIPKAINIQSLKREDIFIESKLNWEHDQINTRASVIQNIEESLKRLNTDYIDLYLIHKPSDDFEENLNIWRVLETYYKQGVLKSIGVSNFMKPALSHLLKHAEIKPVINQVKSNPSNWNKEIIAYCKEQGILPQIYSPLRNVDEAFKKRLTNIGKPFKKTWAQVLLRYHLDNECQVIPMSYDQTHQAQNLDILDFTLPKADFDEIKG